MNEWWPVFLVADGHVQFTHSPAEGATAKYCAVALLEVPVELVPPCSSLPNGFHTPCSSTSGLPILFLTVALEPFAQEASFRFKASSIASGIYLLASLWPPFVACPG